MRRTVSPRKISMEAIRPMAGSLGTTKLDCAASGTLITGMILEQYSYRKRAMDRKGRTTPIRASLAELPELGTDAQPTVPRKDKVPRKGPEGRESVLGPTEFGEGLGDVGQRQADDIKVVAFDAGDVAAGAALDGVGAGFVVGFFGREVTRDFFFRELGEMHQGGFNERAALGVRKANERDSGYDRMGSAGKIQEHMARVVARAGLAEDAAFEGYDGVGRNYDSGADGSGGGEFGFGVRQALDQITGRFAGDGSFVDRGSNDCERKACVAEDFGAAGRGGSENQLHVR